MKNRYGGLSGLGGWLYADLLLVLFIGVLSSTPTQAQLKQMRGAVVAPTAAATDPWYVLTFPDAGDEYHVSQDEQGKDKAKILSGVQGERGATVSGTLDNGEADRG